MHDCLDCGSVGLRFDSLFGFQMSYYHTMVGDYVDVYKRLQYKHLYLFSKTSFLNTQAVNR